MQALKDVGEINALLGNTPLSQSPLWGKPLDELHPAQLHAFLTRLAIDGHVEEARSIAEVLLAQLQAAHARGALASVPILSFAIPQERMTLGELREGLQTLTRPRPAAVLFGLEMDLEIDSLIALKWDQVNAVRRAGELTPMASDIVRLNPRHIHSPYVFVQEMSSSIGWSGSFQPLFGLSLELAAIFNMEWAELRRAYKTIIKLDPEIDVGIHSGSRFQRQK